MASVANATSTATALAERHFAGGLFDVFGCFASVWAVLYDTLLEAVVIAVALHFYSRVTRGARPVIRGMLPRGPDKFSKAAAALRTSPRGASRWSNSRAGSDVRQAAAQCSDQSDALSQKVDQQVKSMVMGLLRRETAPAAAATYERLVREECVDLRLHVTDERHVQTVYIALIEVGVRAASPDAFSNMSPASSASPGSIMSPGSAPPPGGASFPNFALYSCDDAPGARTVIAKLLKDMHAFKFPRTVELYSAVLRLLVGARLFEDALWLYETMVVGDNVRPDRVMWAQLVKAAVLSDRDRMAMKFYSEIWKMGAPPLKTSMDILSLYVKGHDWQGAVELMGKMSNSSRAPDALILNTVVGLCTNADRMDVARKLVEEWASTADTVTHNILLKGYAQVADSASAELLFQRMLENGPTPNIISFNTMLDCTVRSMQVPTHRSPKFDACAAADGAGGLGGRGGSGGSGGRKGSRTSQLAQSMDHPWAVLDQLRAMGLAPDRYTCSTIVKGMHAGCTTSDIDRAIQLIEEVGAEKLHEPGKVPTQKGNDKLVEVLFNTLLDACVAVHDLDRLGKVFGMMATFSVAVSAVTLGTMIKAFGQCGRLNLCHETWNSMLAADVRPTIVTYGCYIDACTRNHDMKAADRVLAQMVESGLQPNVVIYTSLVRGCAHARDPARALRLYEDMRAANIPLNRMSFNTLLDIVARTPETVARVHDLLRDMRADNIEADVVTCSVLVKASCESGDAKHAISLFRELRKHGMAFDEVAFNTLMLACSNSGMYDEAAQIFEEMVEADVRPTQVTASILVKMYGRAQEVDKALEVVERIKKDYGMTPNLHVYTCMIQACGRNQHVRRSWRVFGQMLLSGVVPDAIVFGTVIHGCIYQSRVDQALALVRYAYEPSEGNKLGLFQALGVEASEKDARAAP
eukprot:CAMPEP_0198511766 /NCGR_PEP_ID=MMETSP1462-20131121/15015_1 /TAXON_ID=1333877 /ORGANISM="Brandtodinium nutriculum, Strain RCC3387" /LENGTH=920 /DNA_ID=CAMNT_0044241149 /DNA_START=77 /DNA_END=2836 /DNA_ORIENTATION=-